MRDYLRRLHIARTLTRLDQKSANRKVKMRKMRKMHNIIENSDFADLAERRAAAGPSSAELPPCEAINTKLLPHKTYDHHETIIGFVAACQAHPD